MAGFLLEKDALNGKMGTAFATIDGRNVLLFGLKKFNVDSEFDSVEFPVCGTKTIQNKLKSMKIPVSFTIYYGTPELVKIAYQYQQTGIMPEITLQVTNEDPATSVGAQTIAYYGVKLNKIPLSMLDDSADFLEEEVSGTADRFEPLSYFNAPKNLG